MNRDICGMRGLELLSFAVPLGLPEITELALDRDGVCKLVDLDDGVRGFVLATALAESRLSVMTMAVHPDYRRRGIGRALLASLFPNMPGVRRRVTLLVRETNLGCQLFLRECGFNATQVMRDVYHEPWAGECGYLFERTEQPKELRC